MNDNLAKKRSWIAVDEEGDSTVVAKALHSTESHGPIESPQPAGQRRTLTVEDYHQLLDLSRSRIAGFVFDEPVSIALPPQRLVDRIWAVSSRCIEANLGFVRDHGYQTVEEAIGLPFSTFFPPDETNFHLVKTWVENDLSVCNYEISEPQPDGTDNLLLLNLFAVTTSGTIEKIWVTARDVTERRQALTSLQQAEAHYRTLVERPDLVLVRATAEGRYLYISPYAGTIHGFSVEQLKSVPGLFETLLHPDDLMIHKRILRARELRSKEIVEVEYRARHVDGSYHWYYERQIPKLNDRGEVEFYDCLQFDINKRKQLETELTQARKLEILGSLSGGIAHDFNNHLAAILGQIGICLSELPPEHPSYPRLAAAEQAALTSAEMVKNLLRLSRKSASSPPSVPLDLVELVEETAQLLRHVVPSTITIEVSKQPDAVLNILANPVQLQQVLMNLGVNARDAISGVGTILFGITRVTLSENGTNPVGRLLGAGSYIEVAVSDTGKGIDPKHMERLFEPYFTTKESGKGTGFGLTMVYSIVKEHRGLVLAESVPGTGSTFKFYIPSTDEIPAKRTSGPAPAELPCGTETVLVADDEELVRQMVATALRRQGYTVIEAADGEEALRELNNGASALDLALIDLTMPKVPGRQIVNHLMQHHPSIPVILTSGYSATVIETPEGTDTPLEFLAKPYQVAKLLQLVREILDRSAALRP